MPASERSTAKTEGVAQGPPSVERWLRWSGLVPLPAFLLLHLGRELAWSSAKDVSEVVRPTPGPFELWTAVLLVWLPLTLHAALGVWRLTSPQRKTPAHDDLARPVLFVSRASSLVTLAFLAYHVPRYPLATLLGEAAARDSGFRLLEELSGTSFGMPLAGAAYLLGLAATVTHSGLAVHRALLLEGFLVSPARRRASARLCATICTLLFCAGAAAVIRVATGVLLG